MKIAYLREYTKTIELYFKWTYCKLCELYKEAVRKYNAIHHYHLSYSSSKD